MGGLAPTIPRPVFVRWFVLAFLSYASCWCAAWFAFPNRIGEWLGALVGSAATAGVFRRGGLAFAPWWLVAAGLLAGNATGYFLGDFLHNQWGRPWGMVAWGITFGLGTGGGMGWAFGSVSRDEARIPGQ